MNTQLVIPSTQKGATTISIEGLNNKRISPLLSSLGYVGLFILGGISMEKLQRYTPWMHSEEEMCNSNEVEQLEQQNAKLEAANSNACGFLIESDSKIRKLKEDNEEIVKQIEFNRNEFMTILRIKDEEIAKLRKSYKGLCDINQELHNEIENLKEKLCCHEESTIIINEYTSKVNEELKKLKESL